MDSMATRPDNDQLVLEQAARWYLWLRDHKADAAGMEVFQRWCDSHPKHRRAYERIKNIVQQCDGIDALDLPWPTELEISLDKYDGSYALPLPEGKNPLRDGLAGFDPNSTSEFVLAKPAARLKRSKRWSWPAIAACFVVAALSLGVMFPWVADRLMPGVDAVYVTGVGQQRIEQLEDGSTVTLGGSSQLTVVFDDQQRLIILERGEVFFQVATDTARPFVVEAGKGEIRAVGTAFNVNKRQDMVTVSVVEGIVDVSRRQLGPVAEPTGSSKQQRLLQGHELEFDRNGETWQAKQDIDLERATAWRQGRLAFLNERLDRVIEDVNRYSEQKLLLGDGELADLRYTGTVFNADIDSWLKGLEQAFGVRSLSIGDQVVLVSNALKKAS